MNSGTTKYAEYAKKISPETALRFNPVEATGWVESFVPLELELKAVSELADEHRAQVQNYLKATGFKLGLLVNFGHYPKIQFERLVAERGRYGYSGKA